MPETLERSLDEPKVPKNRTKSSNNTPDVEMGSVGRPKALSGANSEAEVDKTLDNHDDVPAKATVQLGPLADLWHLIVFGAGFGEEGSSFILFPALFFTGILVMFLIVMIAIVRSFSDTTNNRYDSMSTSSMISSYILLFMLQIIQFASNLWFGYNYFFGKHLQSVLQACSKGYRRLAYARYLNGILIVSIAIALFPVAGPVHLPFTIPTVAVNLYVNGIFCLEMLTKYDTWMLDVVPFIGVGRLKAFKDKMQTCSLNFDWCSRSWRMNHIIRLVTSYGCSSIYAYFAYFNASNSFGKPKFYVYDAMMCFFTLLFSSATMLCTGYVNDTCMIEAQKKLGLMDSVEATHLMTRLKYSFSGAYIMGVKFTMATALFATLMAAAFILLLAKMHTARYESA